MVTVDDTDEKNEILETDALAFNFLQTSQMNIQLTNKESDSFDSVIRTLKNSHHLKYVLCWIAMNGYWSGVMPNIPQTREYDVELMYPRPSPGTLEVDPSMAWVHPAIIGWGIPLKNPRPLHTAMTTYLSQSGVDGIKIDVQATVSMFGWSSGGGVAISRRFHESLEESAAQNFGKEKNAVMNSMCCSLEDLYHMKYSAVARVGEDYYPTLRASHGPHIADAAFVTLMVGPISWPDFDMFHSHHEAAKIHAAARSISGGPVYVSDRVDDHDFDVLRRLVLQDGRVLRCCFPGRPTLDCLFSNVLGGGEKDGETALKIWNKNRVTGVVGAFHVGGSMWDVKKRSYVFHNRSPKNAVVNVRPSDIPDFNTGSVDGNEEDEEFALYSDAKKELRVLLGRESWRIELRGGCYDFDLFVVSKVLVLKNGVKVAPIGLVDFYNAGGAVLSLDVDETCVTIQILGHGDFLMYSTSQPISVILDDGGGIQNVEYWYDSDIKALRFVAMHEDDVECNEKKYTCRF